MRSREIVALYNRMTQVAINLRSITITDAWETGNPGANIAAASLRSQANTMQGVLSGIQEAGGAVGGRVTRLSADLWLAQGRRTLNNDEGVCTDCAAAAAVKLMEEIRSMSNEQQDNIRAEIISNSRHAVLVVNRFIESPVINTSLWGEECFVVDIWMQNQSVNCSEGGVYWVNQINGVTNAGWIRENRNGLHVAVVIKELSDQVIANLRPQTEAADQRQARIDQMEREMEELNQRLAANAASRGIRNPFL